MAQIKPNDKTVILPLK